MFESLKKKKKKYLIKAPNKNIIKQIEFSES